MHCSEQYIISRHDNGWHVEVVETGTLSEKPNFASSAVFEDDTNSPYGYSRSESLHRALIDSFAKYLCNPTHGGLVVELAVDPQINKEDSNE